MAKTFMAISTALFIVFVFMVFGMGAFYEGHIDPLLWEQATRASCNCAWIIAFLCYVIAIPACNTVG